MLGGEGMEKAEVEKTAMEKTVIETLAGFAAGLQFEYLPVKVRERANDCLFDLIGCYYGALGREKNVRLLEKIAGFNRMPESVLWGTNLSCGTAEAALGIGTCINTGDIFVCGRAWRRWKRSAGRNCSSL